MVRPSLLDRPAVDLIYAEMSNKRERVDLLVIQVPVMVKQGVTTVDVWG